MEVKHTPGPWVARKTGGAGWPGQIGWAIDYNEDQEQVVDFVYEEADARLIAAAPDLLDALAICLVQLEKEHMPSDDVMHAMHHARAAICKAVATPRGEE